MIDQLRTRRSIRRYTAEPVCAEHITILEEALLRSPSSRGRNPWQFIFVDDPALLARLAEAKPHGASFLKDAPLGVVILGDETVTDVWIEDCAIAAIILQLTAEGLGLGACWIQIRGREHDASTSADTYIQDLLDIPADFRVEAIMVIGHPNESKPPHPADSLDHTKVHTNRW